MDRLIVIWSASAGACLMLALMCLLVRRRGRTSSAGPWFCLTVAAVIGLMVCEMVTMHTGDPAVFERAVRWTHVCYLFVSVGLLGFVHHDFGTGRRWLLGCALGLRVAAVVADFTTGSSLHFIAIHSLGKMSFLGERVSVIREWEANPWLALGLLASLVMLAYVVDASWRLWRTGAPDARRRSRLLGGCLAFFIILAPGIPVLVMAGVLKLPLLVSFPFLGMVLAMGLELLAEHKESEERFRRVIEAAPVAMVMVDGHGRILLVNAQTEAVFGYSRDELLGGSIEILIPRRFSAHHAFLREGYQEHPAARAMGAGRALFGKRKDGGEVPVEICLSPIHTSEGGFVLASIVDVSERKRAEQESALQRGELAHLSRVSVLGDLAGALAHELNQPLAAILSNSQVGRRSLEDAPPDLVEMAAIFDDITADAKRAGGIIHGMRAMLKKDAPAETQPVEINEAVDQVLALLHSELISRKVEITLAPGDALPPVRIHRVEFQQVLINLVMNALDAMKAHHHPAPLRIATSRRDASVIVTVHDSGPGIPPEIIDRLFDPFFSSKPGGLGLGLSISRGIVERAGGQLLAGNHPDGGAVFHMVLPPAHP